MFTSSSSTFALQTRSCLVLSCLCQPASNYHLPLQANNSFQVLGPAVILCFSFCNSLLLTPPQLLTWRTRVSLFASKLTLNLSGMGGPISNHAVTSIGFEFIDALKLPHRAKCAFVEVEIPSMPKMYDAGTKYGFYCSVYCLLSCTCRVKGMNI